MAKKQKLFYKEPTDLVTEGDSEDDFHAQRDTIALDVLQDDNVLSAGEEDEAVLDLESDFESSESEDERLLNSVQKSLHPGMNLDEEADQDKSEEEISTKWGSSKAAYYDGEESSEDEQDKDEEREALRIQRRLVSQMTEEDFTRDEFEDSFEAVLQRGRTLPLSNPSEDTEEDDTIVEHNLSALSETERKKLVKRHCSDVLRVMDKLKDACVMREDELCSNGSVEHTLRLINMTLLQFYLCLRASAPQKKVEGHPIHAILERASGLLDARKKLDIVSDSGINLPSKIQKTEVPVIMASKKEKDSTSDGEKESNEDQQALSYYESLLKDTRQRKTDREEAVQRMRQEMQDANRALVDEDLIPEGEKRKASWKILANKGLTPHRKKENRNPRVKKRLRYEKALKKLSSFRRVAVDKTRVGAYQGETTGIKRDLSRSVRL